MNNEEIVQIAWAEANLQRQLDWISRYDTRITFVTGINVGLLGVIFGLVAGNTKWSCVLVITFAITILLQLLSLLYIYLGQYPNIKSPNKSLLFFGTIARKKFKDFQRDFKKLESDEYLEDLLCQTHINAEILNKKFHYLKISLILMLSSIIPWLATIYFSK